MIQEQVRSYAPYSAGWSCRLAAIWYTRVIYVSSADTKTITQEKTSAVETTLFIAQAILAIALTIAVLLQVKGQGFSGSFGGGSDSIYRTRRGVEKTLFQFTIGLSVVFMIVSVLAAVIVS